MNNQQLQGATVFVNTDSLRFTDDGDLELEYSRAVGVSGLGENQQLVGPISENEFLRGDIEEIVDIVVTLGDKKTIVATFKDKIYWRVVTDSDEENQNDTTPTPSDCDILEEAISPNSSRMGDKKGVTEITCQQITWKWNGEEWKQQSSGRTYPAPADGSSHTVQEILENDIPPNKIIGTYEDYQTLTLSNITYSWDVKGEEWIEVSQGTAENCDKLEKQGTRENDTAICGGKTYRWSSSNDQNTNNGWVYGGPA